MARVTAFANQKGGVAKTTSVIAVARGLAARGRKVLVVDLDPQACLTYSLGYEPDDIEPSIHDVLLGRVPLADVIIADDHLDLVPANIDLAGAEVHLLSKPGREHGLRKALVSVADEYDRVLVDCPPSLGVLTVNGLTAADDVVIPLQCESLGLRGVGQLLETIGDIREYTNPKLEIRGVLATMFDGRTNLAHQVLDGVSERYGLTVLQPPVPKSVRVAEAPDRGLSVLDHAPRSKPALAYAELAAVLDG